MREELFYSNIDVYDCTADDSDLSEQEKEKIKVGIQIIAKHSRHCLVEPRVIDLSG